MSWFEQMVVNMFLGVVRGTVKNPQHAAAVKAQMLGIADDIYVQYGLTPPAHD